MLLQKYCPDRVYQSPLAAPPRPVARVGHLPQPQLIGNIPGYTAMKPAATSPRQAYPARQGLTKLRLMEGTASSVNFRYHAAPRHRQHKKKRNPGGLR